MRFSIEIAQCRARSFLDDRMIKGHVEPLRDGHFKPPPAAVMDGAGTQWFFAYMQTENQPEPDTACLAVGILCNNLHTLAWRTRRRRNDGIT